MHPTGSGLRDIPIHHLRKDLCGLWIFMPEQFQDIPNIRPLLRGGSQKNAVVCTDARLLSLDFL